MSTYFPGRVLLIIIIFKRILSNPLTRNITTTLATFTVIYDLDARYISYDYVLSYDKT